VLTGNQQPDHSRISDFRRRHLDALAGLFVQVLRLCQKAGLVSLGHVALDGTKLKANASKHKAMSHERMLKSERQEQVEAAEQEAAKAESNGDAERGKRASGRARGARKRADDAQKLAIDKAEAARVEPLIAMDDTPAARSKAKAIAGESPQRSGCPRPDGPQAQVQGRSGDLRAAQDDRGAGVRPDKSRTRPGGFQLRGLEKVNGEWSLMATTHNILKLFRAAISVA